MPSQPSFSVPLLVLTALMSGASAASITVVNKCAFTVWPAAIPVGGGMRLNPGKTWSFNVPAGTSFVKIWGRTGCSFNGKRGSCKTGDCRGTLSCTIGGQPPLTLAEIATGSPQDSYDINILDGYNLAMDLSCSTGDTVHCTTPRCPEAFLSPNENKAHLCTGNSNYKVTFCP